MEKEQLADIYAHREERFQEEWKQLLRIRSISAESSNAECRDAAEWLVAHLTEMGMDASLLETPANPIVYAEHIGDPDAPTLMIYGHYDVQPVDPIDAWETPPFEPVLRNGRLYARGAQDNKGQLMYAIKALEVLMEHQILHASVKLIVDGNEEDGSQGMVHVIENHADRLRADILMVHDTSTVASGAPTIVMGLRGIVHLTAILDGPDHDLHSGIHGGLAPNPAQGMATMLASLFRDDGGIAISDYTATVQQPTQRERSLANAGEQTEEEYRDQTGVYPRGGQIGIAPRERVGFLPSIDINGVHSGYGGDGGKTIIPARAIAKISSRIVPGQDPDTCVDAIIRHLKEHVPDGLTLSLADLGACGSGFRLDPDSDAVARVSKALRTVDQQDVAFLWEGASIPIVSALAETAGATPILVGFGREEDRIHAPNESFSADQFRRGFLYVALAIQELQKP